MLSVTADDKWTIARAFGLAGEMTKSRFCDRWDAYVLPLGYSIGYVTRMRIDCRPPFPDEDPIRRVRSDVVCHDGIRIIESHEWHEERSGDRIFCNLSFEAVGATFAAVERNDVPERVFLYPAAQGFDIGVIRTRLITWRIAHPMPWMPNFSLARQLTRQTLPSFLQHENRSRRV